MHPKWGAFCVITNVTIPDSKTNPNALWIGMAQLDKE